MKYIYPIDVDGTLSEDSGSFTNSYRANDGAIDLAVTGIANTERLKILTAATEISDCFAMYVTSGTATVTVKKDAGLTQIGTGSVSAGWNIITYASDASATQWFAEFSSVSSLEFSEMFFAYTFDFPYNYDLGNTDQSIFGVDIATSEGGTEFTNKRHNEKFLKKWNWRSFSETNKTAYKAMLTSIDGFRAKILWYDDSSYHWIRLPQTIFTESAFEIHDLPGGAREQLV